MVLLPARRGRMRALVAMMARKETKLPRYTPEKACPITRVQCFPPSNLSGSLRRPVASPASVCEQGFVRGSHVLARSTPMGRHWLGLLLAGALGALVGCGLTAVFRPSQYYHQNSHMEGYSLATIGEPVAGETTQEKPPVGEPPTRQVAASRGTTPGRVGKKAEEVGNGEQEHDVEEEEEEEEETEFGGIFALEEVDPLSISMLLIGLIVVTIGYEQAVDLLQEHVFSSGIGLLLLGKMVLCDLIRPRLLHCSLVRELAISSCAPSPPPRGPYSLGARAGHPRFRVLHCDSAHAVRDARRGDARLLRVLSRAAFPHGGLLRYTPLVHLLSTTP